MKGTRNVDWRAAETLQGLLGDRGWTAADVARESARTGHPMRTVSVRSIYRVLSQGHKPTSPIQFEIAATLGLLPSHIWGSRPLPAEYHASSMAVAA